MSHKKLMLVLLLVLGLSLLSISAFAQGEKLGERVTIYPWEVGDEGIVVSTDDTVVFGARWGACSKGLAQAWTKTSYINYSLDGESLFSSQKEARSHWGKPYPVMNLEPDNCVNRSETIWVVAWELEFGHLAAGVYPVHFEMGTDHPFHDGFDFDGDGKPDSQIFDIRFDFEIIVIEGGAISGTVKDEGAGPLEGLDVVACRFDNPDICLSAITDDGGNYSMYPVPEGDYRVFVYQQDFWLEEFFDDKPIWDLANPVTVVVGQDTDDVDFDLVMGGSISGFVTDAETEEGIEGLDVIACVFDAEDLCWGAMTEADGSYTIFGIPADFYRVFVYQQGEWMEEFYNNRLFWDEADPIIVFPGDDTGEISFALSKMTIISGRVTNAQDGEGIPGLWVDSCHESVSIDDWGQSPLCNGDDTDEDGYYSISIMEEGKYRLVIWDPSWVAEFYDDVPDYDSATLVLAMGGQETGGIDFELEQAGSISGRVVNEQTGEGIPGLWVDSCHESVSIDDWGQSPLCNGDDTDEDGYYSISIMEEGKYRLVIWDPSWIAEFYDDVPDYDSASLVFAIGGQETGGINFELQRAGSISGTISNQLGDPIVGIGVGACQFYVVNEPACYGAETNSSGEYTMYGLIPDEYLVFVWDQEGWANQLFDHTQDFSIATPVLVVAGQDRGGVNFTLAPTGP